MQSLGLYLLITFGVAWLLTLHWMRVARDDLVRWLMAALALLCSGVMVFGSMLQGGWMFFVLPGCIVLIYAVIVGRAIKAGKLRPLGG